MILEWGVEFWTGFMWVNLGSNRGVR